MTEDQWNAIHGDLDAIRVLLFALAKTAPDKSALLAAFQAQKEWLETALLHSELSESALEARQRKIEQIRIAIWD